MKVLIVDDEAPARQRLRMMLEEMDGIEVIGEAATGREALNLCHARSPDTLLLDIRMPDMDGIEVAMHLQAMDNGSNRSPAVIFITAYGEHALAAFEAQAIDYLLKPIRRERLQQALTRAQQLKRVQIQALQQAVEPDRARTHLCIRHGDRLELIAVSDIVCFHADQKYVNVWYEGGELLIDEPLKALEQEFAHQFIRIHRNALVARHRLTALIRTREGGFAARLAGMDTPLEISRRHVADVRKLLKQTG